MNTAIPKMWYELFEMWLKSIEGICKNTRHYRHFSVHDFTYRDQDYKFVMHWRDENLKCFINPRRHAKFEVNLNFASADVCDPSFDPAVFFEPIKRKLDEKHD